MKMNSEKKGAEEVGEENSENQHPLQQQTGANDKFPILWKRVFLHFLSICFSQKLMNSGQMHQM